MTSQTFNLDLIPQGVPPIVHVSQYDKGQTWNIHIYENGVVFPVPSGTSAAVQGTKPDNTGFQYPAVISVGDNVVTFTVEQQMTVLGGQFECELVLVNGENQVATINFILDVEPTTLDDDTVISETELPLIEQAAELGAVINGYATQIHADAETASTAATTATAAATSASADATTATAAADDATASQTAAAASATNAATSATNAASSESNAATSETNAAASATDAAASAAEAARVATTDMTGATAQAAGAHGLVPAPAAGDNDKFLGGDGTWKDVPAELSGLTDVDLSSLSDGQLLRYDATAQKWKNAGVDSTPTANSANLVSSGGVKTELDSMGSQIGDYANQLNGLSDRLDGMSIYKTAPYTGTTTASATLATATLQKGTYLVFSSGYSSLYGGYISNVGYVDATPVINVATPTTYSITSASSSPESWTRYIVNFLKIK